MTNVCVDNNINEKVSFLSLSEYQQWSHDNIKNWAPELEQNIIKTKTKRSEDRMMNGLH